MTISYGEKQEKSILMLGHHSQRISKNFQKTLWQLFSMSFPMIKTVLWERQQTLRNI